MFNAEAYFEVNKLHKRKVKYIVLMIIKNILKYHEKSGRRH